ncbi:hypothetical protein GLAREA_02955 [Glarea lozoyensis ATCC 20868]|uniref:Heterokaryon incompatibility domain-containing protein n=1 Tax=Glarea lozoyensis (strain ATCC 20868 / MF5171) TaxID=1116229 RepID=S3D4N7_GLAL2|nr:uncharacterized protein GLAREA_02955 [Glarea lozoyensis ATCC 20868]EPE27041.1 hypothetical protein GLAREA_02955 [Glarea lozoyensis ATCC 20868]
MDPFQYEPLQPNGNQIRLLCFSDDPGGQLSYTLKTFKLDECPPYEALSYTWGPALPTKIISLNERPHEVRENLGDFLDCVTRTGITILDGDGMLLRPTYLWVDQICIDQSSNGEKSHQVERMGEIYKQAQRVIVWLGCDDQDSDTAMRLIADISLIQGRIHREDFPNYLTFLAASFNKYKDDLPRLLADRQSLENFLHRPYWSRLWIVQEFVLAQDLLLVCGSHALMLTSLTTFIWVSGLPSWFSGHSIITFPSSVYSLFEARRGRKAGVKFSLPNLLRDFSAMECENPRDKVYGLLGLCDGNVQIDIDYDKPSDELFRDLFLTSNYIKCYSEGWFLQLAEEMGVKWNLPKPRWSTNFNE